MSESPVERSTQNPKGKTNVEQMPEPSPKTDLTEPVQISDPKQSPFENLENTKQTDNTKSV